MICKFALVISWVHTGNKNAQPSSSCWPKRNARKLRHVAFKLEPAFLLFACLYFFPFLIEFRKSQFSAFCYAFQHFVMRAACAPISLFLPLFLSPTQFKIVNNLCTFFEFSSIFCLQKKKLSLCVGVCGFCIDLAI